MHNSWFITRHKGILTLAPDNKKTEEHKRQKGMLALAPDKNRHKNIREYLRLVWIKIDRRTKGQKGLFVLALDK